MSLLSRPYFHDEAKAFEHLEAKLWPDGPVCPHCGGMDRIYVLDGVKDKKGRIRLGLKKCGHCRKQFTVKVGTVFESAHIPLSKMLQAVYLMTASKKGVSSHQLHRTLEITYKSAWFLSHRIREAMRDGKLGPIGGEGKTVEVDETFIGGKAKNRAYRAPRPKEAVIALESITGLLVSDLCVILIMAGDAGPTRGHLAAAGWQSSGWLPTGWRPVHQAMATKPGPATLKPVTVEAENLLLLWGEFGLCWREGLETHAIVGKAVCSISVRSC